VLREVATFSLCHARREFRVSILCVSPSDSKLDSVDACASCLLWSRGRMRGANLDGAQAEIGELS
jgi:hypothetical protein